VFPRQFASLCAEGNVPDSLIDQILEFHIRLRDDSELEKRVRSLCLKSHTGCGAQVCLLKSDWVVLACSSLYRMQTT